MKCAEPNTGALLHDPNPNGCECRSISDLYRNILDLNNKVRDLMEDVNDLYDRIRDQEESDVRFRRMAHALFDAVRDLL